MCQAGHMAIKKVKSGSKCDKNGNNTQVELYYFDVENVSVVYIKQGVIKMEQKQKPFQLISKMMYI